MSFERPPIAGSPIFFLDYDGTLASIVMDPAEAYPHPEVPGLLARLDEMFPLWIVTGRKLEDFDQLLPLQPLSAIGLHGAQEGTIGGEYRLIVPDQAATTLAELRARVPTIEGIRMEEKKVGFALHYRGADDEDLARSHLEEWSRQIPPEIDQVWGKKVLELRPAGIDKGKAVAHILKRYPGFVPVYIGDDVTDEDAFIVLEPEGISIKVGEGPTKARYRLADVEQVVQYLKQYVPDETDALVR